MKQVVQAVSGGAVEVLDVPAPRIGPTEVLVRTTASIVSPGTERAVTALARSGLVAKARARPDLVRQVVQRARVDGIGPAARAVRARLGGDIPLGYRGRDRAGRRGDGRRDRHRARAARRHRWGRLGEPRRGPGGARSAVRAGACRGTGRGRGVRDGGLHRPARAAPGRRRAGRQGGGRRAWPGRPARRPDRTGQRMRRGRYRRRRPAAGRSRPGRRPHSA